MSIHDLGSLALDQVKVVSDGLGLDATDIYKINSATGNLNVVVTDVSSPTANLSIVFKADTNKNGVLDSTDQTLAVSNSTERGDRQAYLRNLPAGTYFAKVSHGFNSDGQATNYKFLASNTGNKPDNLLGADHQVSIDHGSSFSGNRINDKHTSDLYHFKLINFDKMSITASATNGTLQGRLINDKDNNHIVNSGEVVGSISIGSSTSNPLTAAGPGNYYFQAFQPADAPVGKDVFTSVQFKLS